MQICLKGLVIRVSLGIQSFIEGTDVVPVKVLNMYCQDKALSTQREELSLSIIVRVLGGVLFIYFS